MASSAAAGFLGRGNSGSNSNMRGLVQFIADLRNARARELEEKRINKELANIRSVPHSKSQTNNLGINRYFSTTGRNSKVWKNGWFTRFFLLIAKCRWKSQRISQE